MAVVPQSVAVECAEQIVTEDLARDTLAAMRDSQGLGGLAAFDAALMRHPVVYWWPWSERWEGAPSI